MRPFALVAVAAVVLAAAAVQAQRAAEEVGSGVLRLRDLDRQYKAALARFDEHVAQMNAATDDADYAAMDELMSEDVRDQVRIMMQRHETLEQMRRGGAAAQQNGWLRQQQLHSPAR